jgi:hypothetical protein
MASDVELPWARCAARPRARDLAFFGLRTSALVGVGDEQSRSAKAQSQCVCVCFVVLFWLSGALARSNVH